MGIFDFESVEKEDLTEGPTRPRGDTVRALLDHRWVGMALLVFALGVIFNNRALLVIPGFMLVIVLFSWAWSRNSLDGVTYERRFRLRRLFPNEETVAEITVENRKLLPLSWLQIEDEWPKGIGPTDEELLSESARPDMGYLVNTYALKWYERVRRRYQIRARERGLYSVGPAHALTGDPFSLFERGRQLGRPEQVVVYPEVIPLPELGLRGENPFGDRRVTRRLFEDPTRTMGVREYRPTDSFRHIHWKATARTGRLQVRVYEPTRTMSLVLALNVATFEQHWRGVWPEMLEYALSVTASIAYWASERKYAIGLIANGTLPRSDQPFRILPGRSPAQLMRVLEALAGVNYFITARFDDFLIRESPGLPWGSTVVAITPFVNEPILAAIERLHESGRRMVLISLADEKPPEIPGVPIHHLPIPPEMTRENGGDED